MSNFIKADRAIELMEALISIKEAISITNNGKLMTMRIENAGHRKLVPELVAVGVLRYATFINTNDSVRLA